MNNSIKLDNIVAIGKQVLAEQNLDQVLKTSIDKLIELSGAERGFIVLFNSRGENLIQTARNLEKSDIDRPEFEISRTIILIFQRVLPSEPRCRRTDSGPDKQVLGPRRSTACPP